MRNKYLPFIPTLPKETPYLIKNKETNNYDVHPNWVAYHSVFNDVLQKFLSHEGFKITRQPTENITQLNTSSSQGNFLYDSDENTMKVNNGVTTTGNNIYKEIYTRPEHLTTAQISAIPSAKINGTWVVNTDNNKLFMGINNSFKEVPYIP